MIKTTFLEFKDNLFGDFSCAAFRANNRTDFGNNIIAHFVAKCGCPEIFRLPEQNFAERFDYQKTLEVQAPTVDEKTIAEHQIKVVQQIASIEGILSDPHSPAITMMSQNPYAYVNVLTDALKNMRACRYEASVLYASDKKLIFDINTIVDDLGMLVEQIHTTITLVTSLRPEWIDYLQRNRIDVNSAYPFDPKLIELVEAFLKEKTPYGKTQLLADEILKIIRSDEFKERLNFSNNKSDSATK